MWQLNVTTPMLLTAAAIPHFSKQSGDRINVSSVAVNSTFSKSVMYISSKAALEAWSRIARGELRPLKICIGVIAPSAADTYI